MDLEELFLSSVLSQYAFIGNLFGSLAICRTLVGAYLFDIIGLRIFSFPSTDCGNFLPSKYFSSSFNYSQSKEIIFVSGFNKNSTFFPCIKA
jgi:hypothetical protein